MAHITRRSFIELAIALGATTVWADRRDLYPEGVASGDPDYHSVLLWTRRPPAGFDPVDSLNVEVAEDESFRQVVATATAPISKESDWTCRVLVGGLKPSRIYWYRFTDRKGFGSRLGRTITAPHDFRGRTGR
jgi:alkaline phosphatase D